MYSLLWIHQDTIIQDHPSAPIPGYAVSWRIQRHSTRRPRWALTMCQYFSSLLLQPSELCMGIVYHHGGHQPVVQQSLLRHWPMFIHLHKNGTNPDSPKFTYYPDYSCTTHCVKGSHFVKILCLHTAKLWFQRLGLYPHKIGYHYLLSRGAMTLNQTHIPDSTINIIGRCPSYACLINCPG